MEFGWVGSLEASDGERDGVGASFCVANNLLRS